MYAFSVVSMAGGFCDGFGGSAAHGVEGFLDHAWLEGVSLARCAWCLVRGGLEFCLLGFGDSMGDCIFDAWLSDLCREGALSLRSRSMIPLVLNTPERSSSSGVPMGVLSGHVPIEWLGCECAIFSSEYVAPGQCVPGGEGLAFEVPIRGLWCDVAREVGL